MTILYLVSYSPWPPVSGGAWRSYKSIERLAERHDIVVCLCESARSAQGRILAGTPLPVRTMLLRDSRFPAPSACLSAAVGRSQPEYTPFLLRKRWRKSFLSACKSIRPDLVWFSELSTFWRCGPPESCAVVTDMADIQTVKEARTLAAEIDVGPADLMLGTDGPGLLQRADLSRRYRTRPRLPLSDRRRAKESVVLQVALAERWTARSSDVVLLANPDDAAYVDQLARCVVVPNGFDFDRNGQLDRDPAGTTLVFYGLLTYRPNIDGLRWFCDRVWPQVLAQVPTARLEVIGEHDERLSFAASSPNVFVHGFVEDMTEILGRSSGAVVPLLSGGGTRVKIIEAWARRLPVVSTSVGGEGLGARDGVNMLVADEPTAFANACVSLLRDPDLGRRMAEEGFRHGRQRFEWRRVLDGVDAAVGIARATFVEDSGRRVIPPVPG
jgi:glycosyltransferase involved in cell wall biosynthesis